jgi:uncharacterized protein YndB with AHSA1/START domain
MAPIREEREMIQNADTDVRVEVVVDAPIERAFAVFVEQCDDWWPRMYRLSEAEGTDVRVEPWRAAAGSR